MTHLEHVLHKRCEAVVVVEVLHFPVNRQLQVTHELLKGTIEPGHVLLRTLDLLLFGSQSHVLIRLLYLLAFLPQLHVVLNLGQDAHLVVQGEGEKHARWQIVLTHRYPLYQLQLIKHQVHDQLIQVADGYHPGCIRVILRPSLIKVVSGLLCHSQILLLSRLQLAFENNRNEEIEENQRDHKHKADKVDVRNWRTTSIDTVSLLLLISLLFQAAFEENVPLSGAVIHQ